MRYISQAGLPTAAEVRAWQEATGLRPRRPARLPMSGGVAIQAAVKPSTG